MTTLTLHVPAKINLCLHVGKPRPDGYHPLVSVFQSVSLSDELTLEAAPPDAIADEVVCPGIEGPNLAGAALAAYREASGWDAPPVRLTIIKRIPVAAGMGGGSADAAGALKLAAQAAGRPDDPLIHTLAPTLGADVPFALRGGRALVTGIGEHVEPMPPGPDTCVVIVPSRHTLSTPIVYAEADRLGTHSELAEAEAFIRGGGLTAHNDLQPAAISLCPDVGTELDRLHRAGARHVLVSGSGPTVFGTFDDPERAARFEGGVVVRPV